MQVRLNNLTSSTNERLVVLLINLNSLHNGVVENISLLLESLLSSSDLRLSALNLNLNGLGITSAGDVNLGTGGLAELIQRSATLAND